jgi:WXXGXW repeat (2 copies)
MRSGTVMGVRKTTLLERFAPGVLRAAGAVAVFALVAAAAPAVAQNYRPPIYAAQVYVHVGPPALRREVIPRRPGARYAWRAGHWWWRGGRWAWAPGRWVIGPRAGAAWAPGHWVRRPRGWVWRPGHWR